jgi:hypothetical protein
MDTPGKTLQEVYRLDRLETESKEQKKKQEEEIRELITKTPEAALTMLSSVNTNPIRDNAKVEEATAQIKNIKDIVKYAKDAKNEAVRPWETRRKQADTELKEAQAGKKEAGEKYVELISSAQTVERALRDNISEFSTYLSKKEEEEKRKQERALQEAQRKAEEQLAAQQEFLESGDSEKLAEVEQLGQESKKALKDAQEAEYQASIAPSQKVSGVAMRKDITFEVADIDAVPDKYFSLTIDKTAIVAKLENVFPGMEFNINSVTIIDQNKVLDDYVLEDINNKRVLEDLKKDPALVIPGILRSSKDVPIVR